MRKRGQYKLFSRLNIMIAVTMVAMMGLGVSYGYWSDSLEVNTQISTGKLMVEGVVDAYDVDTYSGDGEVPNHRFTDGCDFSHWWENKIGNTPNTITAPIKVANAELTERDAHTLRSYVGSADIIFTVVNTGSIPAYVNINKDTSSGSKQTWLKLTSPSYDSAIQDRPILSQWVWDGRKDFDYEVEIDYSDIKETYNTGEKGFLLKPEQTAEVTIGGVRITPHPDGYADTNWSKEQLRIEPQVSLTFTDATGSWRNNTCNSIFINKVYDGRFNERCNECAGWCECEALICGSGCGCEGGCPCYSDSEMKAMPTAPEVDTPPIMLLPLE